MAPPVRLGIVGFGVQGAVYAKYVVGGRVPELALTAIADSNDGRLAEAGRAYPHVARFKDYRALLASGSVDAIVTTAPHGLHAQMAEDALDGDVHVLIEKPAGIFAGDVKEMVDRAAAKPHLAFGIMLNQRFNPLYRQIQSLIAQGKLGAVRHHVWIVTSWWRPQAYYDQSPWRATWAGEGGGVLVNQAPHQLDLWQWICGMPQSVTAKVGYGFRRHIAVDDEVVVMADYGNDVTGVFMTATHDIVGTDRLEILGDRGKVVVESGRRATISLLDRPEQDISDSLGEEDVRRLFTGQFSKDRYVTTQVLEHQSAQGDEHVALLRNFGQSISQATPLEVPGSAGLNAVSLVNAIYLSSWLRTETVVEQVNRTFPAELDEQMRREAAQVRPESLGSVCSSEGASPDLASATGGQS